MKRRAASPASFFGTLIRCIVIGGFLGMLSSLMVNCSLVEVSCSPFFAGAFGLLFIVTASMMASQIINNGPHVKNRTLLIGFSLMNLFAGATSFLLERLVSWLVHAHESTLLCATRRLPRIFCQFRLPRSARSCRLLLFDAALCAHRVASSRRCHQCSVHWLPVRHRIWSA